MKSANLFMTFLLVITLLGFGCGNEGGANAGGPSDLTPPKVDNNPDINNPQDEVSNIPSLDASTLETRAVKYLYDGLLSFDIEGYEHRQTSAYPDDFSGDGIDSNALETFSQRCLKLASIIEDSLAGNEVKFNCGTPENIENISNRRHFQSVATLEYDTAAMAYTLVGEVDSGHIKASDFSDYDFHWQVSRDYTRSLWQEQCEFMNQEAIELYGDSLILFNCGLRPRDRVFRWMALLIGSQGTR